MSSGTKKGALGRGLAYLGNYNSKGDLALVINKIFFLGKSKERVGCLVYLMTALVENDN